MLESLWNRSKLIPPLANIKKADKNILTIVQIKIVAKNISCKIDTARVRKTSHCVSLLTRGKGEFGQKCDLGGQKLFWGHFRPKAD